MVFCAENYITPGALLSPTQLFALPRRGVALVKAYARIDIWSIPASNTPCVGTTNTFALQRTWCKHQTSQRTRCVQTRIEKITPGSKGLDPLGSVSLPCSDGRFATNQGKQCSVLDMSPLYSIRYDGGKEDGKEKRLHKVRQAMERCFLCFHHGSPKVLILVPKVCLNCTIKKEARNWSWCYKHDRRKLYIPNDAPPPALPFTSYSLFSRVPSADL